MNSEDYLATLLTRDVIPSYCAWPAWIGLEFRIDDYSNFTREVTVRHERLDETGSRSQACEFRARPIEIARSGQCPVCGLVEFTPLSCKESLEANATEAYRRLIKAYSDRAIRFYLIENWDAVYRTSKGRLHVDHIYPVSSGFAAGVPEIVMGSPVNCQLLAKKRNLKKHTTPGQSLEDLLSRYEQFVSLCPEWKALETLLAETGTLTKSGLRSKGKPPSEQLIALLSQREPLDAEVQAIIADARDNPPKRPPPSSADSGITITFEVVLEPNDLDIPDDE